MSSTAIVPLRTEGTGYTLVIVPEAITLRDDTIKASKSIIVTDEATKKTATEKAALLKGLAKECEACRVAEKAPAKSYGEHVDTEAKLFVAPIFTEVARLESSLGAYIRSEEEKARKLREEEQARIRKEQEVERQRQQAILDAQRLAQEATTKAAREKAALEAKRLQEEAEQREMDAAEAAPQQPAAVTPDRTKVSGGSVNKVATILVHDIHALYAAFPECVVLTENKSALQNRIKLLQSQNKPIEIPGVEVSFTTDVRVRATSTKLNLQS